MNPINGERDDWMNEFRGNNDSIVHKEDKLLLFV